MKILEHWWAILVLFILSTIYSKAEDNHGRIAEQEKPSYSRERFQSECHTGMSPNEFHSIAMKHGWPPPRYTAKGRGYDTLWERPAHRIVKYNQEVVAYRRDDVLSAEWMVVGFRRVVDSAGRCPADSDYELNKMCFVNDSITLLNFVDKYDSCVSDIKTQNLPIR